MALAIYSLLWELMGLNHLVKLYKEDTLHNSLLHYLEKWKYWQIHNERKQGHSLNQYNNITLQSENQNTNQEIKHYQHSNTLPTLLLFSIHHLQDHTIMSFNDMYYFTCFSTYNNGIFHYVLLWLSNYGSLILIIV